MTTSMSSRKKHHVKNIRTLFLLLSLGITISFTRATTTPTTTTPIHETKNRCIVGPATNKHHHDGTNKSIPMFQTTNDEKTTNEDSMIQVVHSKNDDRDRITFLSRGGEGNTNNKVLNDILERLRIASYFALWYALNIIYNIINKKVLNVLPAPITIGTIQFGIGSLYSLLLWLSRLRPTPHLTPQGLTTTSKIGLYHSSGQLLSMISLGAGPVSFTHIVKALEPFFSAIVSAIISHKVMKWQVYATLLPVVGGVGYACLKERSFSWLSFYSAMGSNLAFALRAVVSKTAMGGGIGENLDSANLFGVVTIAAFVMSVPIAIVGEQLSIVKLWKEATTAATEVVTTTTPGENGSIVEDVTTVVIAAATTQTQLVNAVLISGLFHYLNNEVMYLALSNVHPVTLAVGNTMKRVFIMVASVLVFRNPVSLQAGIGSAIGISGVLLYSLTKQYYETKELEEAKKKAEEEAAKAKALEEEEKSSKKGKKGKKKKEPRTIR